MLSVLAKLGSPEMVGQFSLGFAVCAPVITFASLQLRAIQATDAKDEYLFGHYLALRFITSALALLVIAGIAVAVGFRWNTVLIILTISIAKIFEAISDVFYGLLQRHEQMKRIAKSMMLKGLLSLIALSLIIYWTKNVFFGAMGLALVWGLVLLGYDIPSRMLVVKFRQEIDSAGYIAAGQQVTLRPCWDSRRLVRLALLSLPLGFALMLISLNTNIPRYFVERYMGERGLGLFSAIAYLQVAGTTVVGALGQSASPRLAQYYADGKSAKFRGLLVKMVGIGALLGIAGVTVAVAAGQQILTLLYQPEYAEHLDVFVWVMVAAGLWYITSMIGYGATASRRIRYQPVALCAVILASFCTCWYLVPTSGLWGAAVSMTIASGIGLLSYLMVFILDHPI
jgi:O-antigen/teichoic acid export membrane protein